MPRLLDGPRLQPKSGRARQLVVLLHGYGADGNDLIDLGGSWADLMPDAAFVSPHAPEPCGMSPAGRQWWELTFRDPDERWRGSQQAAPDLDHFLDEELRRHALGPESLALVGFSQGAMMAMHVAPRRAAAMAGVVAISGRLLEPERIGEITVKPPVLLIHGDDDQVVPFGNMQHAGQVLTGAAIETYGHVMKGTGHGIAPDGLQASLAFIADRFGV